jgi:hypothetical protein
MAAKDRLAQHFLVLLVNRCAGLICDGNAVSCGDDSLDTVGDVIAHVNERLCSSDLGKEEIGRLMDLVGCAMGGEGEDEDEALRTVINQQLSRGRLSVVTLSGNPLRPSAGIVTRMQVSSDAATMVQFGIYDAQGRLVARLLRDVAVAGHVEVRWNGLDLQGQRVPPGTYFYRATSRDAKVTGRIIVLH